MKSKKQVKNKRRYLSTDDYKIGFPVPEITEADILQRYKRKTGIAPSTRAVIRWK